MGYAAQTASRCDHPDHLNITLACVRGNVYTKGMTRATLRIDLKDNLMAEQLVALLRPCRHYAYANQQGSTVYVDDEALESLAELDQEHDGYYDGHYVWFGGDAYEVDWRRLRS